MFSITEGQILIKPTFYFQVFKIMIIQSVFAHAHDDRDRNIKEIVNTFSARELEA